MTTRMLAALLSMVAATSCVSDVPARSTTRITSAETSPNQPALVQIESAEIDARAARIERDALQRELDRERRERNERDAMLVVVSTRLEAANGLLAQVKARMTSAPPVERRELERKIAAAEDARLAVERTLRRALMPSGWPRLRGELEEMITSFEHAVQTP